MDPHPCTEIRLVPYPPRAYDEHNGLLTEQLITRAPTTPANVHQQKYQYDLVGNLTRQTTNRLAGGVSETQCFNYDGLRRLTEAWTGTDNCAVTPTETSRSTIGNTIGYSSAYWTSWAFDDLGHRTSQIERSLTGGTDTTTTYKYDENGKNQPHTLTSTGTTGGRTGSTSYAYDVAGNTTSRTTSTGTQTLDWNHAGKLASVTTPTGSSTNVYSHTGDLLLEKNPGNVTLYLGSQQFTLDTSTNAVTGTRYYSLPGGGSVIRNGASYSFALPDLHGTPDFYLNNTAQTPTWRQYTPYGDRRGVTIEIPDNRGFLNKTLNSTTGLIQVGARQYDSTIGRFISLDPIQDLAVPQQWNGYAYANNSPTAFSDVTGLNWDWNPGGGSGGSGTSSPPAESGKTGSSSTERYTKTIAADGLSMIKGSWEGIVTQASCAP
ncbi:RHS repeat-associated core domain-containing protein, partial [Actinoplanes derwentensis]